MPSKKATTVFHKRMPTTFDSSAKDYRKFTDSWDQFGFYERIASRIPREARAMLDLGIGTGYELFAIFRRLPDARITGVDASSAMLDQLMLEHADRRDQLTLVNDSVFRFEFAPRTYDCVLCLATMHHFTIPQREMLYGAIRRCLKPVGVYIEADKFVSKPVEFMLQIEYRRTMAGIDDADMHHLREHRDIPISDEEARRLMWQAGFVDVSVADREREPPLAILLAHEPNP